MNAWVITWEGTSSHINDENRLVAIIGARRSSSYITELVEFLYLRASSGADEMAYFANRPKKKPHKAERRLMINLVPHGDRVSCGDNPFLYARKVSNLSVVVDKETDTEKIS